LREAMFLAEFADSAAKRGVGWGARQHEPRTFARC
jgi:hypothetical protein